MPSPYTDRVLVLDTGAGTIGAPVTVKTGDVITTGGDWTFSESVVIDGDLTVNGTVTTINTDDLYIKDRFFVAASTNVGASETAGSVYVVDGTVGTTAVVSQWTNATTFTTTAAHTLAAGDLVLVEGETGIPANNGLYECAAGTTGSTVVIATVPNSTVDGIVGTVIDDGGAGFPVAATGTVNVSQVNIVVDRANTDGTMSIGFNQNPGEVPLDFLTVLTSSTGAQSLQAAYDGTNPVAPDGNQIITANSTAIDFDLTNGGFTVDGTGAVNFGGATPLGSFNLDTTGAVTVDSTGGAISIGSNADAQPINIGTGAAARTITIGSTTATTTTVDIIAVALDLDSGAGGTLIDSTGVISLDGVGASNFTTSTGDLVLSTTTSGNLDMDAADAVTINAGNEGAAAGNSVAVTAGNGGGAFNGGVIQLNAGDSGAGATGDGGNISLNPGDATSTNGGGGSVVVTTGDHTGTGIPGMLEVTGPNDEDEAIFTLETTGTNGDKIEMLVGDSDPSGSISALAGSLFFRDTGATGELYLNTSAGSGNSWEQIQTGAGDTDLQVAYNNGQDIVTTTALGPITFTFDTNAAGFTMDGDAAGVGDVTMGAGTTINTFTVDAAGPISLDSGGDSNLTATNITASTNVTMTVQADNTGATAGDATLDLLASSTNGSGVINITADNTVNITTTEASTINVANNAVAQTINVGTGGATMDVNIGSSGNLTAVDLAANAASSFTVTDATLTLSTANAADASADTVSIRAGNSTAGTAAGAPVTVDAGDGFGTGAGGAISITSGDSGTGATGDGGALDLAGGASVAAAGTGGSVNIDAGAGVTGGNVTIDAGAGTTTDGSITIGATVGTTNGIQIANATDHGVKMAVSQSNNQFDIERSLLTATNAALEVGLISGGAFLGRPHGITVDFASSASISNGSDVFGVQLSGKPNIGAGDTIGVAFDSAWDYAFKSDSDGWFLDNRKLLFGTDGDGLGTPDFQIVYSSFGKPSFFIGDNTGGAAAGFAGNSISIFTQPGGAATGGGVAGPGGDVGIESADGGNAGTAAGETPGAGGDVTIDARNGGQAATAVNLVGATGGDVTITAGRGGAGNGVGTTSGNGGNVVITSGDVGSAVGGTASTTFGTIQLESQGTETHEVVTLVNTTNTVELYTGTSDPDGTTGIGVTASAGSLFLRDTGAGGEVYVNTSTGSGTVWALLGTAAGTTLTQAYVNGSTLTTNGTQGDVIFAGTENFDLNIFLDTGSNVGQGTTYTTTSAVTADRLVTTTSATAGPEVEHAEALATGSATNRTSRITGIALETDAGGGTIKVHTTHGVAMDVNFSVAVAAGDIGLPCYMGSAGQAVINPPAASGDFVVEVGIIQSANAGANTSARVLFAPRFVASVA